MELDKDISRETFSRYDELLRKWNKSINLVSNSTLDNLYERHILDSAQLKNYIPSKNSEIIDLGAGAGFPGMVLAFLGFGNIALIESDARKAAFLQQVSETLDLKRPTILNARIELLENLKCDVIVSRAFASLAKIFEYSNHIIVRDKFLLHKGENYRQEIEQASKDWLFNFVVHDSLTKSKGKILEITDVKAK